MLSKSGNPELKNLVKVLHIVGMRPRVLSTEFVYRGRGLARLLKEKPDWVEASPGCRIKPKRSPDKL
ncbi:MAG: hypothetical protein AB7G93_15320 [Bdellovibrionales bacterium]